MDYLKSAFGSGAVVSLLQAYADGLDTDAAWQRVYRVNRAAFEKGYRAHLDRVGNAPQETPVAKSLSLAELEQVARARPDANALTAQLAESYLIRGRTEDGARLADTVLARNAIHPPWPVR